MSAEWLAWAGSLLLKATVLLAAASLLARALRRRSASARHAVWSVTLIGLLVLPLLSALLPSWELPLLPARAPSPPPRATFEVTTRPDTAAPITLAAASRRAAPAPASAGHVPAAAAPRMAARPWTEWLLLAWSLGATVGLLRIAAGAWVARRIARDAMPVTDDEWTSLVADVSRTLGMARPVAVLHSADVALPVVWGYRRPKVLLPPDAGEWPAARKRAFLLHELAHVERHDCLVQTVASVVQALYWPHPLVWWTLRRLRSEAEHACDDRVLSAGTPGPDYANHLLDVARSLQQARPPMVVMGIAERSNLEDRLLALLDPHLRRGAVGHRAVAVAAAAGLALVATVAALQPVARAAVAEVLAAAAAPLSAPPPAASDAGEGEGAREAPVVAARPADHVQAPRRRYEITLPDAEDEEAAPVLEARLASPADRAEAALAPSSPPAAPAPPVVVRLGVDLVQLDAVVTDRDGRQVTDLKPEDFEIREDGRPQKVTYARYVVADSRGDTGSSQPAKAGDVRRVITLVVDDLGLSFPAMSQIRDGLRKLVQEKLGPGDLVAVVTTGKPGAFRKQLTNDRGQLRAAVDALRYDPWNRGAQAEARSDDLFRNTRRTSQTRTADDGIPVGGSGGGGIGNHHLTGHLGKKTLAALEDVVAEMRDLPGRKSLLFFTDQLSLRDQLAGNGTAAPWIDPDMIDGVQRVTDAASRSAVVIYSVGSGGIVPSLETAAGQTDPGRSITQQLTSARVSALHRRHSDFDGAARIADATGGFVFYGGQHVDSVLDVILEDLRGYYLVGYTPSEDSFRSNKKGQREYHEIDVRVTGRGLKVRSRTGFYGVTDQEKMPGRKG